MRFGSLVHWLRPYCKYHYRRVARWRWRNVPGEYPPGVRVCPKCGAAVKIDWSA